MVDIKKINNKLNKISVKIDYLQEQLEDNLDELYNLDEKDNLDELYNLDEKDNLDELYNLDEKDNLGFLYKFYIIVDNYIKPYDINYNV